MNTAVMVLCALACAVSAAERYSTVKTLCAERYAEELCDRERVDVCIFGHTHNAEVRRCGAMDVLFLGEWEHRPMYAAMDAQGVITLRELND